MRKPVTIQVRLESGSSETVKSYPQEHPHWRLHPHAPISLRRGFLAAAAPLLISIALTGCGSSRFATSIGAGPVLLFTGTGTSSNDVAAIKEILNSTRLSYSPIDTFQLNRMTESQIAGYRLFIVPGGNFVEMGNGLTPGAIANVRNAVNGGMNYLGICAGGFLAGSFPAPNQSFNLTSGVKFGFYSAEKNGIRKGAVTITSAEGQALDQYWEDGPQFTGWGQVVGKYPDGTPAIVQGTVGKGWVVLIGIHPEAPASWRRGMTFHTPVSADTEFAQRLIVAALNHVALPHY